MLKRRVVPTSSVGGVPWLWRPYRGLCVPKRITD